MKHPHTSLYRCAQRARKALAKRAVTQTQCLDSRLNDLNDRCGALTRSHRLLQYAARHGWVLSAARLHSCLLLDIQQVQETSAYFLRLHQKPVIAVPSLALLIEELKALELEFETVTFTPQEDQITVTTEPLVLQDHHLGPFDIVLHLDRLAQEPHSGCFDCVALEPSAAEGDASVTHPHVKDDALCAGEATTPIGLALAQGRLCDAFVLMAGVLRTYNPKSPYVSLDDWTGSSCPECGDTCGRDQMYFCETCDRDVCEGCSGHCELCDRSICCSCLEHDPVSGKACCTNCYEICRTCKRVVDSDNVDTDSHLCPECLAQKTEEASNNLEEDSDETTYLQPNDPAQSIVVA